MVSGGAALLFSGFLGFLICEKFGFELIDSGDFYILFMYIGFLVFAIRPFLKITSKENLS
jgi:pilus assembly protein TadC